MMRRPSNLRPHEMARMVAATLRPGGATGCLACGRPPCPHSPSIRVLGYGDYLGRLCDRCARDYRGSLGAQARIDRRLCERIERAEQAWLARNGEPYEN